MKRTVRTPDANRISSNAVMENVYQLFGPVMVTRIALMEVTKRLVSARPNSVSREDSGTKKYTA